MIQDWMVSLFEQDKVESVVVAPGEFYKMTDKGKSLIIRHDDDKYYCEYEYAGGVHISIFVAMTRTGALRWAKEIYKEW